MKAPKGFLEIELRDPEDFLKIRETLTRIGHAVDEGGVITLVQICHILHKRGRYYITHYKELLALDGKPVIMSDDDIRQRDAIAVMLDRWGLCDLVDPPADVPADGIRVVPFKEKNSWTLKPMYVVGRKKPDDRRNERVS